MIASPLILYQFPPALGLPVSESPPCARVEVYLRLSKTPYTTSDGDPRRSPNKMVPFVRWPDGSLQAESGDIIERLEATIGLDQGLDPVRLRRGQELAAHVADVAYDACLYDRFVVPEGWTFQRAITHRLIATFVSPPLVPLALLVVRRKQIHRTRQGVMADPSRGYEIAVQAIEQVAALLSDGPFLCGERPATVDCTVWAHLVHTASTPNASAPRQAVRSSKTLLDWMVRVAAAADLSLDPTTIGLPR